MTREKRNSAPNSSREFRVSDRDGNEEGVGEGSLPMSHAEDEEDSIMFIVPPPPPTGLRRLSTGGRFRYSDGSNEGGFGAGGGSGPFHRSAGGHGSSQSSVNFHWNLRSLAKDNALKKSFFHETYPTSDDDDDVDDHLDLLIEGDDEDGDDEYHTDNIKGKNADIGRRKKSEDNDDHDCEEEIDFFECDEKFEDLKFGDLIDGTRNRRLNGAGSVGVGPPPPPADSSSPMMNGRKIVGSSPKDGYARKTPLFGTIVGGSQRNIMEQMKRLSSSSMDSVSVFGHESTISLFRNSKPRPKKRNSKASEIFYGINQDEILRESFCDPDRHKGHQVGGGGGGSGGGDKQNDDNGPMDESERTTAVRSRVGFVDGREVKFYLLENKSKKPSTCRHQRQSNIYKNINVHRSGFEARFRNWLMKCGLIFLSALYLAAFVAMNLFFAVLFYLDPSGSCCNEPDMTFGEVFAFTVQTSTTIGYGIFHPEGHYANWLVVCLSYSATLMNTVFAGLFFARFVRPEAKLAFSDVMTYCNFNGLPCLSVRVGNVDGWKNELTNVEARLTCVYVLNYEDENGTNHQFTQTEELKLLNDKLQIMRDVWTLRHVLDETSPLFGLHLNEYPGSSIVEFRVSISAIQEITQGAISEQTGYMKEDLLIGHGFDDQTSFDPETCTIFNDYSRMSTTHPQPVWYPAASDDHIMP